MVKVVLVSFSTKFLVGHSLHLDLSPHSYLQILALFDGVAFLNFILFFISAFLHSLNLLFQSHHLRSPSL